jgi:mono/diheme cytochrome c family protein
MIPLWPERDFGRGSGTTNVRNMIGATLVAFALAIGAASSVSAQANLDAGKSPAKLFAQGCGSCHGNPQELVEIRRDFLVQHYTTGPEQAEMIAAYLESVRHAPQKPRRSPRAGIDVADMEATGSIGAALPEPVVAAEASRPEVAPAAALDIDE